MLTSSPMFINLVFNSLVEYLDSKPILELSVHEFLWGYDDQLVKMASNVLPSWINFAKFGLLDRVIIQSFVRPGVVRHLDVPGSSSASVFSSSVTPDPSLLPPPGIDDRLVPLITEFFAF